MFCCLLLLLLFCSWFYDTHTHTPHMSLVCFMLVVVVERKTRCGGPGHGLVGGCWSSPKTRKEVKDVAPKCCNRFTSPKSPHTMVVCFLQRDPKVPGWMTRYTHTHTKWRRFIDSVCLQKSQSKTHNNNDEILLLCTLRGGRQGGLFLGQEAHSVD